MLIEVHIIQNHAPSNLNRDDSGSPKSAMFGGYRRARISSQCLKRCYRTSTTFRKQVDEMGMHTTSMPDEVMRRRTVSSITLSEQEQEKIKRVLVGVVKKGEGGGGGPSSEPAENNDAGAGEVDKAKAAKELKTAQSVFWRERELDALANGVNTWAGGDKKKDFDAKEALKPVGLNWTGIPVDMALFGRMVTSELMHNVEASSQFAHAISTHEWQREFDLWTRVDDRRDKRLDFYKSAFGAEEKLETGTDGMGDAEFTSACFYSYFNVDFDALQANLTGEALKHDLYKKKELPVNATEEQKKQIEKHNKIAQGEQKDKAGAKERACNAMTGLIKAAILERPTGKFNSMATPSLPTLVLVEVRESHVAVSYADAFAKPVDPKNEETQKDNGQIERVDLPVASAKRLIDEANRITKAFNRTALRRYLFTAGREIGAVLDNGTVPAESVASLDDLLLKLRTAIGCPENPANG